MRTGSGWADLRRAATRFSQILIKDLQDNAKYRDSDPAEQYQLGRAALKCIAFRRSLLDRRRGPKWTEDEQLHKMEQQVNSVMSSLETKGTTNDEVELSHVSKELKEFWRKRKNLRKQ
jgi:hypothetical protein